ncbi:aminotransferase class V-fold PLP-dependent enzyme [Sporosarcina ureilytica]|uniref:Aminotransferase n=1 Tax=Sporosarcina ureilytica TaxID=298596 RepID=A0A1D8JJ61_9BACL|nr:aminotransferase class V-fold PLP-dependent enzyme [Sporosarcina ureilytica]AOV08746.1 aminotransferase [Sporosarcina ureilytica]
MIDIQLVREEFPILANKIQLSSCSQSALHRDVKNNINKYIATWENDGMNWELWMEVCEKARMKFAKLINAKTSEIAIVSSVSHAISSIATSLKPKKDKTDFLVSKNDFPCIGHVALSQNNYNIKYADFNNDNLSSIINEKTLLVSVPHVSYYNGAISDLEAIVHHAKEKDSYVFVDAYQSAGQVDIDVKKLNIDFLATGMQKYLLGIPGIAFLYVKEELAETLSPKITGWFGQKNPFAFDGEVVDYAQGAKRFDSGTFPMINGFAADSALDIILEVGVKNIERYLEDLSQFTLDYCEKNNLEIVSPLEPTLKGSNTAIKVDNANFIEEELKKNNILVSARADVIRIAPHFYNTKDDIKFAIDAIKKLV